MKHLKSDAKFIAKYNSSLIYVAYLGEFQSAGLTKTNTIFLCLARRDSELYLVAVFLKKKIKNSSILLHRGKVQSTKV